MSRARPELTEAPCSLKRRGAHARPPVNRSRARAEPPVAGVPEGGVTRLSQTEPQRAPAGPELLLRGPERGPLTPTSGRPTHGLPGVSLCTWGPFSRGPRPRPPPVFILLLGRTRRLEASDEQHFRVRASPSSLSTDATGASQSVLAF
ncbi:hypothetical protein NDU88_007484 [Pleurodeles waltl]|uniref:Uncharacterized protein n=1 Tax=Pleurodeles waltl TaxID=8319 RepID=A0AAV7WDM6_PLEWA|nr:hypothetical protein NDU88_007484 [Pleurodeles waltl]